MRRPLLFVFVGVIGFIVQTLLLLFLTSVARWPVWTATTLAVESAILVNFIWHERLTWKDRDSDAATRWQRLSRFHAANGLASLVGTVTLTWVGVHLGLHLLLANSLAVCVMAAVNYRAADRWVFRTATLAACLTAMPSPVAAAELKAETITAWNRYVAQIEQSLDSDLDAPLSNEPRGRSIDVPSGTISEWSGSILIHNRTVTQVVDALVQSVTLPTPEEVIAARILSRDGDRLHTYMRLVRKALITVTYDTEHRVEYTRISPSLATSQSIATKIEEVDGDDRGFMWRLQSYWRYRQVGHDVRIDMRSLTLSRATPWLLKPIASPIVERIGRESVKSTLNAVATFLKRAALDTAARTSNRPATPNAARASGR